MVRFLVFISFVLFLQSCILDQKLTLLQTKNESNALKLDGIYLHEDSLDIVDMYFLYQDGTILSRGSIHKNNLEAKLADLEISRDDKYKSMKFLWGRYIIDGDKIKFQKWGSSDRTYITVTREGRILNDSTFVINKYSRAKGKGTRKIHEVYRFRKMKTKPDSENRWVGANR